MKYGNSKYGIIKHFKIKIHPIYNYLDLNRLSKENIYKSGNKDLLTILSCYKYNEDVISAYQDPIFRDINNNNHIMDKNYEKVLSTNSNINIFLQQQYEYIEKLDIAKKKELFKIILK
jgi:hypothetical protein